MRELPIHVFNRSEVHGGVLPNRRMRTAARLDAHNALRGQRLRACENELVFPRVNVVGNHVNVVVVPEPLAERFNKRRFAGANRTPDPNAQRAVMTCTYTGLGIWVGNNCHERNSLVYCVSCAIEARSTMNAADPRSSIVAFLASVLAASTVSSSSAMASCPSV